ncbi:MAG TPA: C25 family cysteine peptidase, partial [Bacteroidales bacterium]|nr:C25 family cysteine peptidase [Bacteroidales bacterium]
MKKDYSLRIIGFVISFLLLVANMQAQSLTFRFQNNSSTTGFTLENSRSNSAIIRHSITQMSLETLETEKVSGQVININGIYLPNNAGAPNLPGSSRYIAVPEGATARLELIDYQKEVIENVDLLPAAAIPLDTDDRPADYIKDMNIYSKDGLYPAEPFQLSKVEEIRGVDVVMLGITPFQYNPVQKQLIVYHNIQLKVVFDGGNGQFGDSRLRSRWWDPLLKDMIINYDQLPEMSYTKAGNQNRETGAEYLIIIPDNEDFVSWADSIRLFRVHQGISTMIINVNDIGGNTVSAFESYFNEAYNTWDIPPSAVLLLGDYSTNGTQGLISHLLYDHPGGYNPYITDNPFSDVSGNMLPDIVFARITANNSAQLELMINKFLEYERNPPVNQGFYDNPITAMGWQTERWFQLCSEIVNGFWEHSLGKSPVRENAIYSGSPGGSWSTNTNTSQVVNYFGPLGLNYIPGNTSHLTDWGGNATRINNDINNGAFMIQHRDHGYEGGWGEPDYGNNNINGLNNDDLTFVWSVNCLTGKFNYSSESFAEKFHRHPYGAVGLVAATEVSYSFVNDVYVWGAFDNMWPQFMPDYGSTPPARAIFPAFANAAGKIFLQQSSWPYNPEHKPITYNLFHHHGDAFLNVYSEMPQELTVDHMPVLLSGLDIFEVKVEQGAWIALTVGDEIIGTAEAVEGTTQIPITIQEPGSLVRITITKQNYFRYDQVIECIPPEGAYVIFNENVIHDDGGNENGIIDFGETIHLDIALKNVGNENAATVSATLLTDSPFVTITQNEVTFG